MASPLAVATAALRALQLPRAEQRAAVSVAVVLVLVSRTLASRGLAATEARLRTLPRALPRDTTVSPRSLASLVNAVARHLPQATCLARSLTVAHLVSEVSDEVPVLKIGVRPGDPQGDVPLDAHAWVELNGVVLNDSDDVGGRYSVIESRPSGGRRGRRLG